jgi:5-methyltetrahydrofolate--homocysteine methyltransferase
VIVIGEKINGTRKGIAKAIRGRDRKAVERQVTRQDEAGADYIDLNAGTGAGPEQETEDMLWLLEIALAVTERPLSIDSPNPTVIRKAAAELGERPWLLNSVKAEEHLLADMLPLAAERGVPVIALAMSGEQIPADVDGRVRACGVIYRAAEQAGVAAEQLLLDPLVLPVSSDHTQGQVTLGTLRRLKVEFPQARTTMGLSNLSFGLKQRSQISQAFLVAAMSQGLDSAICDPTDTSIQRALALGRLLAGQDRYCRGYSRAVRRGLFDT